MHAWEGFFTAQVASTAALAGLLFVALSVNVARILQYPWLPERAAQTLVVLMGALAISSFMLFPAASARIVNYLAVGTALFTYALTIRLSDLFVKAPPEWKSSGGYRRAAAINLVASQAATLPMAAGSMLLAAGHTAGYYWIACGVIVALAFALLNSWVLLVEILR
jgi:modulator of FtsH protease